jgi:hypothetical protein
VGLLLPRAAVPSAFWPEARDAGLLRACIGSIVVGRPAAA